MWEMTEQDLFRHPKRLRSAALDATFPKGEGFFPAFSLPGVSGSDAQKLSIIHFPLSINHLGAS